MIRPFLRKGRGASELMVNHSGCSYCFSPFYHHFLCPLVQEKDTIGSGEPRQEIQAVGGEERGSARDIGSLVSPSAGRYGGDKPL